MCSSTREKLIIEIKRELTGSKFAGNSREREKERERRKERKRENERESERERERKREYL